MVNLFYKSNQARLNIYNKQRSKDLINQLKQKERINALNQEREYNDETANQLAELYAKFIEQKNIFDKKKLDIETGKQIPPLIREQMRAREEQARDQQHQENLKMKDLSNLREKLINERLRKNIQISQLRARKAMSNPSSAHTSPTVTSTTADTGSPEMKALPKSTFQNDKKQLKEIYDQRNVPKEQRKNLQSITLAELNAELSKWLSSEEKKNTSSQMKGSGLFKKRRYALIYK